MADSNLSVSLADSIVAPPTEVAPPTDRISVPFLPQPEERAAPDYDWKASFKTLEVVWRAGMMRENQLKISITMLRQELLARDAKIARLKELLIKSQETIKCQNLSMAVLKIQLEEAKKVNKEKKELLPGTSEEVGALIPEAKVDAESPSLPRKRRRSDDENPDAKEPSLVEPPFTLCSSRNRMLLAEPGGTIEDFLNEGQPKRGPEILDYEPLVSGTECWGLRSKSS